LKDYLKPRRPKLSDDKVQFGLSESERKMASGLSGLSKITMGGFLDRLPVPTSGIVMIPVEDIVVGEQVRKVIDPEKLRDLAENIRRNGLINPVTVRKLPEGKYELVAGHRRFFAVRDVLGRDVVECKVVNVKSEVEKVLLQLSENAQREDLHPVELANAIGKVAVELIGAGGQERLGIEEIGDFLIRISTCLLKFPDRLSEEESAFVAKVLERCGVTRYQLAIAFYVYLLPDEVKEELSKLDVNLKHLRVMFEKQLAPEEVLFFARMAHEKGLSASSLKAAIDAARKGKGKVIKGVERVYSRIRSFERSLLNNKYVREVPEVRQKLKEELLRLVKALDEMDQ